MQYCFEPQLQGALLCHVGKLQFHIFGSHRVLRPLFKLHCQVRYIHGALVRLLVLFL